MASFNVGDKVKWTSQSGGVVKEKVGVVVARVPGNSNPATLLEKLESTHSVAQVASQTRRLLAKRETTSYLVAVQVSPKAKPRVYWPSVNHLVLVRENENAAEEESPNEETPDEESRVGVEEEDSSDAG
jgi:hypothetical protein